MSIPILPGRPVLVAPPDGPTETMRRYTALMSDRLVELARLLAVAEPDWQAVDAQLLRLETELVVLQAHLPLCQKGGK